MKDRGYRIIIIGIIALAVAFILFGTFSCSGPEDEAVRVEAVVDDFDMDHWGGDTESNSYEGVYSYWFVKFDNGRLYGWTLIELNTPYFHVDNIVAALRKQYNRPTGYIGIDYFEQVPYESFMSYTLDDRISWKD